MRDDDDGSDIDLALVVELGEDEWRSVVSRLLTSLGDDERQPTGRLHVLRGGGRRRWAATDGTHLFVLDGSADDESGSFLIPPRVLEPWPLVAADSGVAYLDLPDPGDPDGTAELYGDGAVQVSIDSSGGSDLDVDAIFGFQRSLERHECVLDAADLEAAARMVCRPPSGVLEDEEFLPPFVIIGCGPASVNLSVLWGAAGMTNYDVRASSTGHSSITVSPASIRALIGVLAEGEVRLSFPTDRTQGLIVEQEDLIGLIMPIDDEGLIRESVEDQLADLFGPEVRIRDADGDYVLATEGVPVWARLVPTDEFSWVVIFAQVLVGVEEDPDLLTEVNQLNVATPLAKILVADGVVSVQGELVAETLDDAEVVTLYERVRTVAADLGPTLAVRFGGRPVVRGEDSRWIHYTRTVLHAELTAGNWSRITGPEGADPWPFDAPVFVVTAANPAGRIRTDADNAVANARLAGALVQAGAGFHRALGTDGTGTHREESFLVWGITVEAALEIGAQFAQEAIFELTADRVSVLGVGTDRRDDRGRLDDVDGAAGA